MFTGIVEELGTVRRVDHLSDGARLRIHGPQVTSDANEGDSIAVNGVCLTAIDLAAGEFSADVMAETLRRSTLGDLVMGDQVNLERPMRADGRFGGHIVLGHVDGMGTLTSRENSENWDVLRVEVGKDLARYLVVKGSITVDGVSLTVVDVHDGPPADPGATWFSVSLIPTTLASTSLGRRKPGERVNLEVDVIGKYVERLLARR